MTPKIMAIVLAALAVAVPLSVIGMLFGQQWVGYIALALSVTIFSGGALFTAWENWCRT